MKRTGLKSIMLLVMFIIAMLMFNNISSYAEEASQPTTPETKVEANAETTATQASQPDTTSQPQATTEEATQTTSESVTAEKQEETPAVTAAATEDDTVPSSAPMTTENVAQTGNDAPMMLRLSTKQAQPQATSSEGVQNKTAKSTHTILHTNDIHGRMVEEKDRVLGMAKLKTLKEQQNPDLLVDAGDAFQGLPLSNQSKGEEMAKAMNAVGYDAMTAGNHEFDFGYDQLKKLEGMLNFPIVSSNVYKDGKLAFKPSVVIQKNGVRYGIIGVTTPETKTKTSPTGIVGVTFADPLTSVTREMDRLNGQVDVFVVLSHLGIDPTTKEQWRGDYLTRQLSQNNQYHHPIFVIDGHSHTVIEHGQKFDQDVLAQTGTALANVGKITFEQSGHQFSNAEASLLNVKSLANLKPDATVKAQVDKANEAFLKATSEVIIPNNTVDFQGERDDVRTHETNLGNAIADAMEAYGQNGFSRPSDFAVTNSGGIRASIAKGKVTLNDVITVLPFGNTIAQISVKGSDVWKAFEHSLSAPTMTKDGQTQLSANGGLLQVSKSIQVYFDMNKAPGQRIHAIRVLNKQTGQYEDLDMNRTYAVAMNDFTASGGDGFDMFGGPREEGISLEQVFAKYLKTADLSQYAITEPQRIINGKPAQNSETPKTTPPSSKGDNVIPFPQQKPSKEMPMTKVPTANGQSQQSAMNVTPEQCGTAQSMAPVVRMTSTDATGMMSQANMTITQNGSALGHHTAKNGAQQLPNTGTTEKAPIVGGLFMLGAGLVIMRRQKHRA
ncbi:multifunctional 2',3'-cyclic-nucleotide 2'-phosphodiesterase/5'-nucleotidase/3'-nucleotidase [Staphylococcus intermedius]|uniref:5'-nucleotidase C-terminal domain-containing protein n=1 Tax=Staphylococcus intermedius TaxID=1285 RepID=UPI000BBC754C|nr:5'-nucleotidase C-terminal domain-containing protein [Staphylococcus intermedius]PCF78558.1 multifunctional 2',3'-cyclic-nucleotide 2'-phosphodiesterase/5'-nucleotidase/3'-nucleotidase [Staphylococcus intermedius]